MTGPELAEALRRVAALVEGQTRIAGLVLEVAPGATLKVRTTAAERQRRHREKDRYADVTHDARHSGVTKTVTECDQAEPLSPHTPLSLIPPSETTEQTEERTDETRASGTWPTDANRNADVTRFDATDSDSATICPLDLVERAVALEVVEELARKLKQPPEVIVAGCEEFVSYWTIGGGCGRKKTRWMRMLREHLRRGAAEGKLKALGLVMHEANTGKSGAGGRKWTVTGWDMDKKPNVWTDENGRTVYKNPFQEAS